MMHSTATGKLTAAHIHPDIVLRVGLMNGVGAVLGLAVLGLQYVSLCTREISASVRARLQE